MSREFWSRHWPGVTLTALGVAAIISLGLAGRLTWYVHPRYELFTLIMACLGAGALVASLAMHTVRGGAVRGGADPGGAVRGGADPGGGGRGRARAGAVAAVAGGVLVAAAFGCLAVLPPATLSAASTGQRPLVPGADGGLGTGGLASALDAEGSSDGLPDAQRSMRDWSMLLRQHDASLLTARSAHLLGFVTADPDDPDSLFIVTRFVITCCAVDAQPIGVPVYLPDWQRTMSIDDWVEVEGSFAENPSVVSAWPAAVLPRTVERVERPEDPYVG